MVKLTVEIKEDTFVYEYEVGESRHHSTSPLSAEFLVCFTDLLKLCASVSRDEMRRRHDAIMREAYKKDAPNGESEI